MKTMPLEKMLRLFLLNFVGCYSSMAPGFERVSHFLCSRAHFSLRILTDWMNSSSELNCPVDSIETGTGNIQFVYVTAGLDKCMTLTYKMIPHPP